MPLGARRARPSISGAGADDVSNLSLTEVRDRLERNERVLNSGLFAPTTPQAMLRSPGSASPMGAFSPSIAAQGLPVPAPAAAAAGSTSFGTSPTSPSSMPIGMPIAGPSRPSFSSPAGNGGGGAFGTSPTAYLGTSPSDPIREKLLAAREQLLAREAELLGTIDGAASGSGSQDVDMDDVSGGDGARRSSGPLPGAGTTPRGLVRNGIATSGKRQVLELLRQEEERQGQHGSGVALRFDQSHALAERDFAVNAADSLSRLTMTASSSPKPRRKGLPAGLAYPEVPPSLSSRHLANSASSANPLGLEGTPTGTSGFDPDDEIARAAYLARVNAFMTHKPRSSRGSRRGTPRGDAGGGVSTPNPDGELIPGPEGEEAMDEDGAGREWYGEGGEDGVDELFDSDSEDGHYPGEDGRLELPGPGKGLRMRGTGEEVDEYGENDEQWETDNDDLE